LKYLSKTFIFLYMVVCVAIFIFLKTIHFDKEQNISISILQNSKKIISLDQPKSISFKKDSSVKYLFFPPGKNLYNKSIGYTGFTTNFFVKAEVNSIVKRGGLYHFVIYSDDGFRLSIDKKTVCQYLGDRPYLKTECSYFLKKGKHDLKIDYFQGYGPLGLKAGYSFDGKKYFLIGKDSRYIIFKGKNGKK